MAGYTLIAMYAFGRNRFSGKEIHHGSKSSLDDGKVYPYKYEDSLSKSNGGVLYKHWGRKIAELDLKNDLLTIFCDKYSPHHDLAIKSWKHRINQLIRPIGFRVFQKNYELYYENNSGIYKLGNKPLKITVPAKFRG